jgi:hypothetical protein
MIFFFYISHPKTFIKEGPHKMLLKIRIASTNLRPASYTFFPDQDQY